MKQASAIKLFFCSLALLIVVIISNFFIFTIKNRENLTSHENAPSSADQIYYFIFFFLGNKEESRTNLDDGAISSTTVTKIITINESNAKMTPDSTSSPKQLVTQIEARKEKKGSLVDMLFNKNIFSASVTTTKTTTSSIVKKKAKSRKSTTTLYSKKKKISRNVGTNKPQQRSYTVTKPSKSGNFSKNKTHKKIPSVRSLEDDPIQSVDYYYEKREIGSPAKVVSVSGHDYMDYVNVLPISHARRRKFIKSIAVKKKNDHAVRFRHKI